MSAYAGYRITSWNKFIPQALDIISDKKWKNKKSICNDFMSLDTETSHIEDDTIGWVYQWCFSYPGEIRTLVYGRKPSQLIASLNKIREVNNLDESTQELVIYVHNLKYDFAYLCEWLRKEYGHGEYIAIGSHKVICFRVGGFYFKCSYTLSMKSLATWGDDLHIKHGKLVGEIDYDIERYQDTPLYRNDWRYMFRDIISLDECITSQMKLHNDDLLSIPLTNTGYVRRHCRSASKKDPQNRKEFLKNRLSLDTYVVCKKAFSGGYTHQNRFFANKTIVAEIGHRDFVSHYPSQQICKYAPSTPFILYYDRLQHRNKITIDEVLGLDKCCLINILFEEVHIKEDVFAPYLQASKLEGKFNYIADNGRILDITSGSCSMWCTELDLDIINRQYELNNENYTIIKVYSSEKGPFPEFLRDCVKLFFYDKTRLKKIVQELEEKREPTWEESAQLQIAKGMLNGIYGMSATDPVRSSYEDVDGEWKQTELTEEDIIEKLDKFYNSRNSFMSYQLGVWTTAHARHELFAMIDIVGPYFLYSDTDSIFYVKTPEIEANFKEINEQWRKECDENGWFIVYNDKRVYFHQFEEEKEVITKFRGLHAKCYAYIDRGELKITVAGVAKRNIKSKKTREQELGNINNLKSSFTFYECGGTGSHYNYSEPTEELINGHLTEYASSCIIQSRFKTLNNELDDYDVVLLDGVDYEQILG